MVRRQTKTFAINSFFPRPRIPCFSPTFLNAARRVSRWRFSWAAESWVRMLGLALGNDREEEADRVDSFVEEVAGEILRQFGVVEHDRHDRALPFFDIESGILQRPRQYLAFHSSLSRRSVLVEIRSITFNAPATITGATVLENRYGRAV